MTSFWAQTKLTIFIACGSILSLCAPCRAQPSLPSNQHPLATTHLGVRPGDVGALPVDTLAVESNFFWTNTYNQKRGIYLVDAETRSWETNFKFQLTDSISTALTIPVLYRGGGILDSVVKEWDNTLGIPNNKRNEARDDQFYISGVNRDGSPFEWRDSGTGLGNLEFSVDWAFVPDEYVLRSRIGIPTASGTYGAEGTDIGLALIGETSLEKLAVSYGGEALYYPDTNVGGVEYREFIYGGFVTARYAFNDLWVGSIALLSSTELARIAKTPDFDLYLDFVVERKTAFGSIHLFVRENPTSPSETADITLGVGTTVQSW